jgi:hypothetical protein
MYTDEDEIHPDEFDDLMDASRQALARDFRDHVEKNKCDKVKELGDQILVWDTSRLTDVETGDIVQDELDLTIIVLHPSIVVETQEKYTATLTLGNRNYDKVLDLKIWNKTLNKIYRTSSDFVKFA